MAVVSKSRVFAIVGILHLSLVTSGETESDENPSVGDEAQLVTEAQERSDGPVDAEEQIQTKDEPETSDDSEKLTESEQSEPYKRLPVQTRINPNQNVDLPQDI